MGVLQGGESLPYSHSEFLREHEIVRTTYRTSPYWRKCWARHLRLSWMPASSIPSADSALPLKLTKLRWVDLLLSLDGVDVCGQVLFLAQAFFAANPLPSSERRISQQLESIRTSAKMVDMIASSNLSKADYWAWSISAEQSRAAHSFSAHRTVNCGSLAVG